MRIDRINLSGSLSISSSLAVTPLRVNDNYLFVSNTGNVGIGTNNPTSKLVVTGSIAVQGQLKATTLSGSFTGSIKLPTIPLGTSETNIVLVDGSGGLVYRSNLSLTGAQGNQGATGFQGTNGTIGVDGAQGFQGFQGTTGAQGATGANAGITSYINPSDNRVITSVSSTEINAESNLTFDGSVLDVNTTAALKIPVGTTEERPVSPSNGMIRTNATTYCLEYYINNTWISIYCVPLLIDYLVVAGGGGCNNDSSGGGGGGGFKEGNINFYRATTYTIIVGASGAYATNGGNSVISGSALTTITATGGGYGAGNATAYAAGNGGSGGGGSGGGGGGTAGTGISGQGNNGGAGKLSGNYPGGGGGGAGAAGSAGVTNGGNGGAGKTWTINGLTYAGGGGGNGGLGAGGTGGSGGGGNGGSAANQAAATDGSVNTGGGAGGGGASYPKAGGKGVVFIRSLVVAVSTTGSPTVTTPSGYYLYEFKDSGTITF